jgi:hypothetical protein
MVKKIVEYTLSRVYSTNSIIVNYITLTNRVTFCYRSNYPLIKNAIASSYPLSPSPLITPFAFAET